MNFSPFREIWLCDFEFSEQPGEHPRVICMVAREYRSGRLIRLWRHELLALREAPFPVGSDILFIAFSAAAELSCFLALGWPLPMHVLDLMFEFRVLTNGNKLAHEYNFLNALSFYGLDIMSAEHKAAMQERAVNFDFSSPLLQPDMLDYCQEDTDSLRRLLDRIASQLAGLGPVLMRGRYASALARMKWVGVPLDVLLAQAFQKYWQPARLDVIAEIDQAYGVYDECGHFHYDPFEALLARKGITNWPRTETGKPVLEDKVLKTLCLRYPEFLPFRELRATLNQTKQEPIKLLVGRDGRNRAHLWPFGAVTGRNLPKSNEFVFGRAVWLRGLIKPEPGYAVIYLDYRAAEVGIGAALSGDPALIRDYRADPYLALAKSLKYAPEGATKHSHGAVRELFKPVFLAANYGQGAKSLSENLGTSVLEAQAILDAHYRRYPVFKRWMDCAVSHAMLHHQLRTQFDWRMHCGPEANPRALRNWPLQSNCADILRLACCLATERGVRVTAPVHDAILVEARIADIDEVVHVATAAMKEASSEVLAGFELKVGGGDKPVAYPNRYWDERGAVMWKTVTGLVAKLEAAESHGSYSKTADKWSA
jgi:hypothetical protein